MPCDEIEFQPQPWPSSDWKGAATGVTLGVLLSLPVWIGVAVAAALLVR